MVFDAVGRIMTTELPLPLLDDIANGKCLPFLGAGFSINARLPSGKVMPDWRMLTETLAMAAKVPSSIGGPHVSSIFQKKFGRPKLIEEITKAIHHGEAKPGASHLAMIHLPFDVVFTTNFDLLLEDACALAGKPYRSLAGESQLTLHAGSAGTTIVKMHGDVSHPEHVVITKEDYDEYVSRYQLVVTYLMGMLATRTPLFVGYSRSDPDFRHVRAFVQERLGKFERTSYLIRFDVSPDEARAFLEDNLHVISIPTNKDASRDSQLAQLFSRAKDYLDCRGLTEDHDARQGQKTPLSIDDLVRPDALTSAEKIRLGEITVNVIHYPEYLTQGVHEEFWALLDKTGRPSDSEMVKFRDFLVTVLRKHHRYFFEDAVWAIQIGRPFKSAAREQSEKTLARLKVITEWQIRQNEETIAKIACKEPLRHGQTPVVLTEEMIWEVLNKLDDMGDRLYRLYTPPSHRHQ